MELKSAIMSDLCHVPSAAALLAIELGKIIRGISGLDVLRRSVEVRPSCELTLPGVPRSGARFVTLPVRGCVSLLSDHAMTVDTAPRPTAATTIRPATDATRPRVAKVAGATAQLLALPQLGGGLPSILAGLDGPWRASSERYQLEALPAILSAVVAAAHRGIVEHILDQARARVRARLRDLCRLQRVRRHPGARARALADRLRFLRPGCSLVSLTRRNGLIVMSPRVAVVGVGLVGLSTAWFLQEHGLHVTVYERHHVAAGSSSGNAGWLSPALAATLPKPAVAELRVAASVSTATT